MGENQIPGNFVSTPINTSLQELPMLICNFLMHNVDVQYVMIMGDSKLFTGDLSIFSKHAIFFGTILIFRCPMIIILRLPAYILIKKTSNCQVNGHRIIHIRQLVFTSTISSLNNDNFTVLMTKPTLSHKLCQHRYILPYPLIGLLTNIPCWL